MFVSASNCGLSVLQTKVETNKQLLPQAEVSGPGSSDGPPKRVKHPVLGLHPQTTATWPGPGSQQQLVSFALRFVSRVLMKNMLRHGREIFFAPGSNYLITTVELGCQAVANLQSSFL